MNKTVTFISWNVNGIRAIANKNALNWIDKENIDILALQEVKAQKEQVPDNIFKRKYKNVLINSANKKGYSGTAIYTDINIEESSFCDNIDSGEGRIIQIKFNNIIFFNIYFPNGQSSQERLDHKMKFYDDFLIYINELRAKGYSIIICGDVNTAFKEIDLANPKANENTSGFLKIERDWIAKLISCGHIDTFRHFYEDKKEEYSWWSYRTRARERNVGWRIDYFFISEDLKDNLVDAFIRQDIFGSDHCPVGIKIKI